MQKENTALSRPRAAFLLLLAIGISILFYWMIKGFLVAVFMAAVLAALLHPLYRRMTTLLGGRKTLASGVSVLLSLVLVILPFLFFMGVLVNEAVSISESAREWAARQAGQSEELERKLAADEHLKQLLPYQDEITARIGKVAATAGSYVAGGLAAGAQTTMEFFLMVFVMLYGMFFFLTDGRDVLDAVLRFTPLTEEDKSRLLVTFASVGRATLKGTLIIGIVQGGLGGLAFWAAGIGGVVFWSAVMAVLSVLPGIGSALVWVPAVIFLLLNGQIGAGVGVGLWCAIVVGTADNFLRPVLVGKDTEMPDLLVMLTTLGGLALFGAAGLVIGPIIGALYVTVWKLWGSAVKESGGNAAPAAAAKDEGAQGHGDAG